MNSTLVEDVDTCFVLAGGDVRCARGAGRRYGGTRGDGEMTTILRGIEMGKSWSFRLGIHALDIDDLTKLGLARPDYNL